MDRIFNLGTSAWNAVLVMNIADGRICFDMAGLKKYHFIDKNFIVIFV